MLTPQEETYVARNFNPYIDVLETEDLLEHIHGLLQETGEE